MARRLYFISGLGADERIFQKLQINCDAAHYMQWVQPGESEDLLSYARRMAEQIHEEDPILVGLSFGGMIAIEIAHLLNISKVILISSIKSQAELPLWMRGFGACKVDRILPRKPLTNYPVTRAFRPIQNYFLGAVTEEEKKMANEYRDNVDPIYLRWSINKIFNWKNDWVPPSLYHIHGTNDHIFPIKRVQPTHAISNGGHFMVMNQHQEISRIINEII